MKNIKQLFLLGLFSFLAIATFAQDAEGVLVKQSYINILPLSYNIELPVSNDNSVLIEAGAGFALNGTATENSLNVDLILAPFLELDFRHYYKFKSENKKGKSLFLNSGNYLFGTLSGSSGTLGTNIDTSPSIVLGGGWGVQRVYQNNFVFNFGIGLGYHSNGTYPVSLLGDLGLGILISKNRQ